MFWDRPQKDKHINDKFVAPQGLPRYTCSGFRGGMNLYRNFHRNWEMLAPFTGTLLSQPVLFIAGETDNVVTGQILGRIK